MSTDVDWQHELDSSFGSGHDLPPAHYVSMGKAAVRRRRATWSASGVAAVVVLGLGLSLAPGDTSSNEAPIGTERTTSPTTPPTTPSSTPSAQEVPTSPGSGSNLPWRKGDPPARATPRGLEIRPGAVVHEVRNDLFPGKATSSAALDISYGGERWWMSLEWGKGGAGFTSTKPEDGLHESFEAFVRAEIRGGGMTREPVPPNADAFGGLVRWAGGDLETLPGVVIVRQVQQPEGSSSGSIGLVLRSDGEDTWMLIDGSGASATWTLERNSGWLTFEQWLADQVAVQSGESGLQLVSLQDDGSVTTAAAGVEILDQRADPVVRAYGTEAPGPSAVALVEWRGERWFILAVQLDGPDTYTTVATSKADGAATLEDFVAFMADRADEGGMR